MSPASYSQGPFPHSTPHTHTPPKRGWGCRRGGGRGQGYQRWQGQGRVWLLRVQPGAARPGTRSTPQAGPFESAHIQPSLARLYSLSSAAPGLPVSLRPQRIRWLVDPCRAASHNSYRGLLQSSSSWELMDPPQSSHNGGPLGEGQWVALALRLSRHVGLSQLNTSPHIPRRPRGPEDRGAALLTRSQGTDPFRARTHKTKIP
jgi:hypothetical protein